MTYRSNRWGTSSIAFFPDLSRGFWRLRTLFQSGQLLVLSLEELHVLPDGFLLAWIAQQVSGMNPIVADRKASFCP
jgi:hypothetical protein